ncbi:MAG: F0F1 ATP synthase subunit A [Candidatus Omnitrophica bacterium]|nr:F0F1 ATP synthase subunit A [Candidatus Omnitrophota bacterium]
MKNKYIAYLGLIYLLFSPVAVLAQEGNVSAVLSREISNGKTLDIFPFLPTVQLPLGISAHFFMLLLSAGLILSLFFYGKRHLALKPRGLLVVLENMIGFVQEDIVFPIMGEAKGEKWLPFFCTLFLFLLTSNLLGLIPCFKTATGNINVTSALAAMILILVFSVGIKSLGTFRFFKNFFPAGVILPIGIFVAFLEFTGLFLKTAILSLRLFSNMFAGHLAIFSFLMLIFILSPMAGIFAVPFTVFTYLLEVIVGFIQAFVFTLLSCIFITMASSVHE